MFKELLEYCSTIPAGFEKIYPERKQVLQRLSFYIDSRRASGLPVRLLYVCTHNSRRSHFGQVWSRVASAWYKIEMIDTFSGGTEVTAFNPNAVKALKQAGFIIAQTGEKQNPVYEVLYDQDRGPIRCFSKRYDDPSNPPNDFAAIMTCSEAEDNCPYIPGCDIRVATTYEDPRLFDGTAQQEEKYRERCRQIAVETFYLFSQCRNK